MVNEVNVLYLQSHYVISPICAASLLYSNKLSLQTHLFGHFCEQSNVYCVMVIIMMSVSIEKHASRRYLA